MPQVAIENPVINSPFEEPTRHFRFNREVTAHDAVDGRWTNSCFVPIPQPTKSRSVLPDFVACIEDGHGEDALDAGGQQPGRLRTMGLPQDSRPAGRAEADMQVPQGR